MPQTAVAPKLSPHEDQLLTDVLSYVADPAGFVSYIFPWEESGSRLEHAIGPERWHLEVFDYITAQLTKPDPIRIAIASGHGTAKTTFMVQLVLWFMSTRAHPQIRITASTANQLSTVTWRELAYWQQLAFNAHWFHWTATRFYRKGFEKTWYAAAVPWSADKPQSFAGVHAQDVLLGMDEASTIDDPIWEVCDGAMSTPGAIWLAVGNPEQATGRFRDCFGRLRSLWQTWQIDARTARITNKAEIARQIEAYGEDSDFVRVRWLGKFPRQGPTQFISEALVEEAQQRVAAGYEHMPKVLGVDVGGQGTAATVLTLRQGVKIEWIRDYHGLRTDQVADEVAKVLVEDADVVMVFVDVVGIGAGVHGDLIRLGYQTRVMAVISGAAATELLPGTSIPKYYNLRAQMWGKMKEWLEQGGCLPNHTQLAADLVAPQYAYAGERQIQLERKVDMVARGLPSTDYGDSLAFTFARPVAPRPRPVKIERPSFAAVSPTAWMAG
jgi:hypothetical protein